MAASPKHKSYLYHGDIHNWYYHDKDEFNRFCYDFVPGYHDRNTTHYTANASITSQVNKFNQIKAGVSYRQNYLELTDVQFYNEFPYSDHYEKKPVNAAAYLQDELKYKRLTLNAGLRFDYFKPKTNKNWVGEGRISKSKHQWSPRVSLLFPPFRGTSVSASYGHCFQPHPLEWCWALARECYRKSDILQVGAKQNFIWGTDLQMDSYYKWWKNKKIRYGPLSWRIWGGDISLTKTVSPHLFGSVGYFYLNTKAREGYLCYFCYDGIIERECPLDTDVTNSIKSSLNAFLPYKFGPRIRGLWPFSNINVNLQHRYYSGSPYTPQDAKGNPLLPNSKRLPSTHQTDMKIVKSFKATGGLRYGLFLDVRNLFNVKNVTDIYYKTGEPDDNGEAPIWDPFQYQNYEQRGYNSAREWWEANYANWKEYVNHPIHYGIPRIVRIGIWVKL